jgi:hypothetical protein
VHDTFPALSALAIDNNRTVMERYVVAADDLSEGAFLAHPTMLSVQLDGSGLEEQITEPSRPTRT